MFLRSIQIRGFKSFADKTTLEFTPGVSVVVGPNGSGKSNLVDAIAWVLGEQGARALRGGQMADVIFAGTPSRPALGMAEVKLVIDNEAGKIPVPMSEIEISRTIFRSGDSEYRIGGQVVRLLDVQELLSETGIGRALHTVVGQGQLEEVLLARPEERRKYIEEAAGVAKHRRRKERAERKLGGLDQDLLRLQDVHSELRRQLKPLQQQAETAKRHEELTQKAEELSRKLAGARLRALLRERDRRRGGWDEGLDARKAARARLDELDGDVLAAADARASAAEALRDAELALRAAERDRSAAELDYRSAVDAEAGARASLASQAGRAARLEAAGDELRSAEEDLARVIRELEAAERERDEAEASFQLAERRRREAEDARRRAGEEAATRRAEAETLRGTLGSAERERGRLDASLGDLLARLAEMESERDGLEREIERLDERSSPLGDRRGQLEEERRALVRTIEELEEALRRMEQRRELLEARRADIEETAGSRFIRSHPRRSSGLLRDLVRVEPGYERSLAAALGGLADAIVYDDGERALADASEGDGAILAIAAGGPVPLDLLGERGILTVVNAEPVARGIVSAALKDVYLAGTVEEAAEKQRRHPRASFVTREGVLVGPSVIHTAGEADVRVREIRAELQVLEHDLAATRGKLKPRRSRLEEIGIELDELLEHIEAVDAAITSSAERLAALEQELAGSRKEEEVLKRRTAEVGENIESWRTRLASVPGIVEPPAMPPPASPPIQTRVTVETLRRERGSLDQRAASLRAEREELAAHDPEQLRSKQETAEQARAAAERAAEEAEEAFGQASAARSDAAAAERSSAERETAVNRAWREASMELDRLREAYEEDDRLRGDIERRIREAERLIREGHGADPDELVSSLIEEEGVEALEKRATLVQRRLGLLGRVNLLATGEFEALQERHDFMQRELEDVRKARRDLLEVIAQVDRQITDSFASAFADVAGQFERLIGELFPGGQGRLVLTDPANPLESGIEIEASPGRKRVRRISLLSGGERSLTALAFLFAIFTARPSPFYLMDEVEPALDDVNLHRFLRLVEGFAADAQVLIVTHQKRTMEVAGMMYGVSLAADGTTKVVCQRLEGSLEKARKAARREAEREEAEAAFVVPESEPVG